MRDVVSDPFPSQGPDLTRPHPHPGTDPGLFNWKIDRKIVDGEAPFEFRIRDEPFDVKKNIIGAWREIVAVHTS